MGGTVLANLLELVGLPHLTGYLLAGVATGPYVLGLVSHNAVEDLLPVNQLALSLIALAGGAELRISALKSGFRSLAWATLWQNLLVMVVLAVVFVLARPLLPFLKGMPLKGVVGVGLLWGVIAVTRSPSATLGILSQTRAKGPLAGFTLNFVMTSDVVVVVLLAVVMTFARPLIIPGTRILSRRFSRTGRRALGQCLRWDDARVGPERVLAAGGRQGLGHPAHRSGAGLHPTLRLPRLRLAAHFHDGRLRGAEFLEAG